MTEEETMNLVTELGGIMQALKTPTRRTKPRSTAA
jgi:hypothetical protein